MELSLEDFKGVKKLTVSKEVSPRDLSTIAVGMAKFKGRIRDFLLIDFTDAKLHPQFLRIRPDLEVKAHENGFQVFFVIPQGIGHAKTAVEAVRLLGSKKFQREELLRVLKLRALAQKDILAGYEKMFPTEDDLIKKEREIKKINRKLHLLASGMEELIKEMLSRRVESEKLDDYEIHRKKMMSILHQHGIFDV